MTKEKKTVTLKEVDELLSSNLSEEKFDMMKSNINKDELDLFKTLVTIDQLGVFRINKDEYDNWKDEYGETIPYVVYRVNREIIKEYL